MKKYIFLLLMLIIIILGIIKFGFISVVDVLENNMHIRLPYPSDYKIILETTFSDDNDFHIWYYDNSVDTNLIVSKLEEIDDDNYTNIRLEYKRVLSKYFEYEQNIVNEHFDVSAQIIKGNYYLLRTIENRIRLVIFNMATRKLYYMSVYK